MPESKTVSRDASLVTAALVGAVFVFFFVSGACGLVYQVVWTRKLVLLFGTTAYAVSTVLTVFFLGLGLGSFWGGRFADRTGNPLRAYGLMEIAIGLWAAGLLFGIDAGEQAIAALLRAAHGARALAVGLRSLLALLLMFLPVFLMGATLPLLARFVNRDARIRGARIGLLYSVNTFGAVCGCFVAGFFLIAGLGYTNTTLLAAVCNVAVGAAAILVSCAFASNPVAESGGSAGDAPKTLDPATSIGKITALFGVVGFCMLAFEVIWTRLLVLVFLGTTYAYTTMLTTLLCGIAAGGAVAAAGVDRVRRHVGLLGAIVTLIGIACLFTLGWLAELPARMQALQRTAGDDWAALTRGTFKISFLILFLPTFLSGMAFPIAVRAVGGPGARVGRNVGRLYAANTIGGVAGAALGGFVLLPLLGSHEASLLLACVLIAAGLYLLRACPATSARARMSAIGLLIVPLLAIAWYNLPVDVAQALNAGYVPRNHRMLDYREGVEGTVAVSEPEDETGGSNRVLWINRVQATASIEKGVRMNRLQGVLPLLFDRDPRDVLFMCLGSGITAGTLALSDFERIDAVEISPDVLETTALFAVDNLNVRSRENVFFHIDDGRNYLLTTDRRYDVITFEPMPMAIAGVSTFYTQEYYRLCMARLNPGGLVSQWVPLHSLNLDVVRSLVRTFISVFPEYCAFFVNADLFLIGSDRPLALDYAAARASLETPALKEALGAASLCDVAEVFGCFAMGRKNLALFAEGGRIMTDDRPWAEFEAPKLVYERHVVESLDQLRQLSESPLPLLRADSATPNERQTLELRHRARINDFEGLRHYYGGLNIGTEAARAFLDSLRIDAGDCNARYYVRELIEAQCPALLRWREFEKVEAFLSDAVRYLDDVPEVHLYRARAQAGLGRTDAAEASYRRYLDLGGTPDPNYGVPKAQP